ncbi:MerR family DNA-binding transcriptional regulator [Patescibacteria group bacterium]|nr:MerR family DNA-binding transcriptional regulator [Patescibacteria group bacterium]MBU4579498.1 MerR family DNA-binding transcriptional regulator [Patescibacteria group bacterium]
MNSKLLTISQAAKILGVSIQTLRRWDDSGKLSPSSRKTSEHRHYLKGDIENYVKNNPGDLFLFKMAWNWVKDDSGVEPLSDFYCPDISVFQARLTRLESELGKIKRLGKIFPLISAITGEIGNNSYDHNLGNWPDILGIFFARNLDKGIIVLADRGQGVLSTLKKVKPELINHQDALRVAFTEVISGRAPEYRGNGLKFVKDVVTANEISLFFQTGDAQLKIQKNDSNMGIQRSDINFRGCLAAIKF